MPRAYSIAADSIATERRRVGDDLEKFDIARVIKLDELTLRSMGPRDVHLRILAVSAEHTVDHAALADTVGAFVGEPDYMVLKQVPELLAALGANSAAAVADIADDAIVAAVLSGGFGTQRISSHIMIHGLNGGGTLPLSASFALMGQRYVVDSHVFSNVVFDRAGRGSVMRMMPSPLDAAFAALGNNQAATLLAPERLSAAGIGPSERQFRKAVERVHSGLPDRAAVAA